MEEKKSIKISLSAFFLILAIITIVVMGLFIYKLNNEKSEETKKSAELQAQVDSLNGTVSNLQNKINNISETINSNNSNLSENSEESKNTSNNQPSTPNITENIKYDVEVSLSEIENIKSGIDTTEIEAFYKKYKGKTIKVTGYVSAFGDEYDSNLGVELATGVNIGNSQSYQTRVYAYGVTYNSDIIKKIHNLKEGSKVSLIGTLPDSWSQPVEIHLTNIIEE